MTTYKYKSKDGQEFFVPGVGQSEDGILVSQTELHGSNFELIDTITDDNEPEETPVQAEKVEEPETPVIPAGPLQSTAPVAAPGAVLGVAPQATQPTNNTESTS